MPDVALRCCTMLARCCPSTSRSDRDYKQEARIRIAIPMHMAGCFAGAAALKSYVLLLYMALLSEFANHVSM